MNARQHIRVGFTIAILLASIVQSVAETAPDNVIVRPLLGTHWGQGGTPRSPFSWYLPGGAPAGSGPVAMAQILAYYDAATDMHETEGTRTCTVAVVSNGVTSTVSVEVDWSVWFDRRYLPWRIVEAVPETPSGSLGSAETYGYQLYVGKLLSTCGALAGATYDLDKRRTTVSIQKVAEVLTNEFGFLGTTLKAITTSGESASQTSWANAIATLQTELGKGRPVILELRNGSGGTLRHLVVADGVGTTGSTIYVHLALCDAQGSDSWVPLPSTSTGISVQADGVAYSSVENILYDLRPDTWLSIDDLIRQISGVVDESMLESLRQMYATYYATMEATYISASLPCNAFATYGFAEKKVLVEWRPYTEGATYTIKRATAKNPDGSAGSGTSETLSTAASGVSYEDTAAKPGVVYRYTVVRNTDQKEMDCQADACLHVAPPTGFFAVASASGAALSWTPAAGAFQTVIYRAGPFGTQAEAQAVPLDSLALLTRVDGGVGSCTNTTADLRKGHYRFALRSYSLATGLSDWAGDGCVVGESIASLSITGADSVTGGKSTTYNCQAVYPDGSTKAVTPAWSLVSGNLYGSITAKGVFTADETDTARTVTIQAVYGGKTAQKTVSVAPTPGMQLDSISIEGAASVASGGSAAYACRANYANGSVGYVTPTWTLVAGASYGSITTGGVFTANAADTPSAVTLQATYQGMTATKVVVIALINEISGSIVQDSAWNGTGVWHVTGDLTLSRSSTLVIPPGTIVKFAAGARLVIENGSTLDARGTLAQPIVFTSLKDDGHGGDTNGDGTGSMPAPGDWRQIEVAGTAMFDHCSVLYASSVANYGAIEAYGGTVTFDNGEIAHTEYDSVNAHSGGAVTLRNSAIWNGSLGLGYYGGEKVQAVNCVFSGLATAVRQSGKRLVNCVFHECDAFTDQSGDGSNFGHCLFWNPAGSGVQTYAKVGKNGNLWGNPLFSDATAGNFRIAADSPCVDAGDGEAAPETDRYGRLRMNVAAVPDTGTPAANGSVPDIGLYEVDGGIGVSSADLAVTAVSAPGKLTIGSTAKISWTVANVGTEAASGDRRDEIEIVAANGRTFPVATVATNIAIAAGKSAAFSSTVRIPSAPEGDVRVRVTVNKYQDIFESRSVDNNVGETAATLAVPSLAVPTNGTTVAVKLPGDSDAGYAVSVPGSASALLVVQSSGMLDAWLGDGAIAARDNAIRSAVQVADGTWLLQIPAGAEPRVTLANGGAGAATAALSLAVGAFRLFDAGGVTAANTGIATVPFYGNGFAEGMACWIEKGGVRIDASSLVVESEVNAVATFDVNGRAAGQWTLHVSGAAGSASLPLLTLSESSLGVRWFGDVDIPSSIRAGRTYLGAFRYGNDGDAPTNAPYVRLEAKGDTFIRWSEADAWAKSIEFLAASDTYPASLLKAGDSSSVTFQYKTTGKSAEIEYALTFSSTNAFPWTDAANDLRPSWANDTLWGFALATLRGNFGETWDSYLARLRADCDHLMEIGSPVKRLDRLWQLEIGDALGVDTALPQLASVTDLARSARGLSLVFTRSYASSLCGHLTSGVLGYGWTDNFASSAELQDSETLVFHLPSGGSYFFTKATGTWQPQDARDKTKLTETNAAYVLEYASGTVQTFSKSLMKTTSLRDNAGNELTYTYSDGKLAKITHTDGQSLTFTYSGDYLAKVADDQGRTAAFQYSNGLLQTVTAFTGLITRYEYLSAAGKPWDKALSRIVYPDGTTAEFEYDERGRLSATTSNGGKLRTRIVRGDFGSYSVIAPNGGTNQVIVGASGETLKTVAADGSCVRQAYSADVLLESVVSPGGRRSALTHDRDGNPVTVSSASGATTTFSYEPDFGSVASVADAKGHAFNYGYDELGRNVSVTYADGSAATVEYNARGDLVKTTNRRGQSVAFAYDAEGRLVKKTWPDGRVFTLAYDAKGNVTNATDSATGTVSMEYDANERMTKIVHPKGRGFTFAYDAAGRLASRTLLGGAPTTAAVVQRYAYDSFGRLAAVTDGNGAIYVTNAYDTTSGWLVTQTYGNGTVVSNAYDVIGRTVGIYHLKGGKRLAFFEYAYDEDGRCVSQTTAEGVERYSYDADGQLTGVFYPDGTSESFAYDAVGNRTTYTVNELNQYVSGNGATFTYDADGNMTSRTDADGTTTYTYDVLNRLVGVTNKAKGIAWSCQYDVFGNRVSVTDNGTTTERLFVQGELPSVAAEYDGGGAVSAAHVLVGAVRIADVAATPSASRYYHADLIGSARLLTDGSGATKSTRSFKVFGETRKASGESTDAGYVGTLGIETDSTGLLFMRNRYYDVALGRFAQMDPMGLDGGTMNLYVYCHNSPLGSVDVNGTAEQSPSYLTSLPINLGIDTVAGILSYIKDNAAAIGSPAWLKIGGTVLPPLGSGMMAYKNYKAGNYQEAKEELFLGTVSTIMGFSPLRAFAPLVSPAGHIGKYLGEKVAFIVWANQQYYRNLRPPADKREDKKSDVKISWDPNEIAGTAGVGEARYVERGEWLEYTIYFENKTNATAAAQEVFIDLPMDPNLDWTTLELGEIVFGENIDTGLSGKARGKSSYAMPGAKTFVNSVVQAKDGILSWYIRDWDPATADNFPAAAEDGFLPPNDAMHRGEGRVSYRVRVKADAADGVKPAASAKIRFDQNEVIETNPSWFNTIAAFASVAVDFGEGTTDTLQLVVGEPVGELPVPRDWEGWQFNGWFTGVNGSGFRVTAETVYDGSFSILHAYWTAVEVLPTNGDLYVDAAIGNDANDGKSWATAKASIQAAIDISIPGDLILVNDGRYEPISVATSEKRDLTIASVHGAEKTIIDGSLQWARGVTNRCATLRYYDSGSHSYYSATLAGFTLVNGLAGVGGGSYYGTLENCVLMGNRATSDGGGAYYSTLNNCVLVGNRAIYGGGTTFSSLYNCTVVDNTANSDGGAAYGGRHYNCIIWGNTADGKSSAVSGPYSSSSTNRYSCSDVALSGRNDMNNISVDPLFLDAANGDYRLRPGSPCINAGTNSLVQGDTDVGGHARIVGERVDMGAWEFNWDAMLAALGDALDGPFAWTTGGDSEWFDIKDGGAEGGACAKSGVIGDSQTTWLETQVKGEGTVSFRWKVSSQARLDLLSFSADGVRLASIGGTTASATNWAECSFEITGDGVHALRWAYGKSASGTAGEDRAWLDDVRWKPLDIGEKIGEALEAPELVWSSGDYDADSWKTVGEDLAWDGEDSCAAYAEGSSGVARLETSVNGSGTLEFYWRIGGGKAQSGIAFMVDGEDVELCDSGTWAHCSATVSGTGRHLLVWEYFWDGETNGEMGFLDHVTWTPDPTDPIPAIPSNASPQEVVAAIQSAEFRDASAVQAAIGGNVAKYNAFKAWAGTVKEKGGGLAGEAGVVASPHAAASWLLGVETLFGNEPAIRLTGLEVGAEGKDGPSMRVTVEVKDGDGTVLVDPGRMAGMFEATGVLGDWSGAAALAPAADGGTRNADGTMSFDISPGGDAPGSVFLRVGVK